MADIQLYDFDTQLANKITELKQSSIIGNNKKLILDFHTWQEAKDVSKSRRNRQIHMLTKMAIMLGKDFSKATIKDYQKLVAEINGMKIKKNSKTANASAWYKADMRVTLKTFLKWLKGKEFNPNDFDFIKTRIKPNEKRSRVEEGDILTIDEIENMIKAASTTRDKAILSVAYESAARPSELLTLRIGNIKFDKFGAIMNIQESKTQPRPVRLLQSAIYLRAWINAHPLKNDPRAPVWISTQSRPDKPDVILVESFNKLIKTAARKAGIKQRVYPYLLRHTRITHLLQDYPEQIVKKVSGHAIDSKQFRVYSHISNKDVDAAMLKKNGYISEDDGTKTNLKRHIVCWNCGEFNPSDVANCKSCSLSLDGEIKHKELLAIKKEMNEMKRTHAEEMELLEEVRRYIKVRNAEKSLVDTIRETTGY